MYLGLLLDVNTVKRSVKPFFVLYKMKSNFIYKALLK